MKTTNTSVAFTLAALIASAVLLQSCGGGNTDAKVSGASTQPVTSDAEGYLYPDVDYNGYEFKVLNYEPFWNCNMSLDFSEQNGEALDDAIYNRNRKVEEKLNFKLCEINIPYPGYNNIADIIDRLSSSVMAGDNEYDAAYLPISYKPSALTEGYLLDLNSVPELQLDEEWWDGAVNDSMIINNKIYTASSPLQLMSLDMSWVLLFNQNIMDENKLDYPYQLVRDGKWTLDKFNEYVTSAASLNGDESFTYSKEGNALYGIAIHPNAVQGFLYSSNIHLLTPNGTGFDATLESDRLYSTLDKLIKLLNVQNGNQNGNTDNTKDNYYIGMFHDDRALFMTCELKASLEERDMQSTFVLLPFPKYDESQSEYFTAMNQSSCFLTIPSNAENTSRMGTILDALTYESWKSVLPVYYDITVSQKGLRNEESIEMLDIIRSGRGVEFSQILGITNTLAGKLQNMVIAGETNSASIVAANKDAVMENLDKTLKSFK